MEIDKNAQQDCSFLFLVSFRNQHGSNDQYTTDAKTGKKTAEHHEKPGWAKGRSEW